MSNRDKTIVNTIAKNSTSQGELIRITYVFSDKIRRLTKNEMIFRTIAMESEQFTEESFNALSMILQSGEFSYGLAHQLKLRPWFFNTSIFIEEKSQKERDQI